MSMVIRPGGRFWYEQARDGRGRRLHRADGPAVELNCGQKEWWQGGDLIGIEPSPSSSPRGFLWDERFHGRFGLTS